MLKFQVTDCRGRKTEFVHPVKAGIVFSGDAPADSLTAVFAVEGKVRELLSVNVTNGSRVVFSGEIDEQTEYSDGRNRLLEIKARSCEAILLDNEAKPQTYLLPSMPLLMSRHFAPLGFARFVGEEKAFNGQFDIVKGMSEWEVLESFCTRFTGTAPRIKDGVIDISGKKEVREITVGRNIILTHRKILRRSAVLSHVYSRTSIGGGYEKELINPQADALGVVRRRYVNSMSDRLRPVPPAQELLDRTNAAARRCETTVHGFLECQMDDLLRIEGEGELMKIREIHYSFSADGETTKIYSEVMV